MLYVFHSSPEQFSTRVTVVGYHENNTLVIGVARCGKKDNFCRKKGRTIATGRILKGKHFLEIKIPELSNKAFIGLALVVSEYVSNTKKTSVTLEKWLEYCKL